MSLDVREFKLPRRRFRTASRHGFPPRPEISTKTNDVCVQVLASVLRLSPQLISNGENLALINSKSALMLRCIDGLDGPDSFLTIHRNGSRLITEYEGEAPMTMWPGLQGSYKDGPLVVSLDIGVLSDVCQLGIAGMMICGRQADLDHGDGWVDSGEALALAILSKHSASSAIIFVPSPDVPASSKGFRNVEYHLRAFGFRGHILEVADPEFAHGADLSGDDQDRIEEFAAAVAKQPKRFLLDEAALWPMEMLKFDEAPLWPMGMPKLKAKQ